MDLQKWGSVPSQAEYHYGQLVYRDFLASGEMDKLNPGDIIGVERLYVICPYVHYAVYAGEGKVIHYAPLNWDGDDSFAGWDAKSCKAALKNAWNYNYDIKRSDMPSDVAEIVEKLKNITDIVSENVADAQECFIHEAPFSEFLGQFMGKLTKRFFVLRFNEDTWKKFERVDIFSLDQTLERARKRIGESNYKLTSNNCEHFAMWCRTGLSTSRQAEMIEELLKTYLAEPIDKAGDLWQEHQREIDLFLESQKPLVEQKLREADEDMDETIARFSEALESVSAKIDEIIPSEEEVRQKIFEFLNR
ncbi:MAG: lecithin retinol acyltransferase family protein [Phascolarctobacterium sp.]|nr:lecithin retinol acyltransferase family protein [Phascolarctobacterium sp.]